MDYDVNYYKIGGSVEEALLEDETDIIVRVNDTYYKAYHTGTNGYTVYMKKKNIQDGPAEIEVLTKDQEICRVVQIKKIDGGEILP